MGIQISVLSASTKNHKDTSKRGIPVSVVLEKNYH